MDKTGAISHMPNLAQPSVTSNNRSALPRQHIANHPIVIASFKMWEIDTAMALNSLPENPMLMVNRAVSNVLALLSGLYETRLVDDKLMSAMIEGLRGALKQCVDDKATHFLESIQNMVSRLTLGRDPTFWATSKYAAKTAGLVSLFSQTTKLLVMYQPSCRNTESKRGLWSVRNGMYERMLIECTSIPTISPQSLMQIARDQLAVSVSALRKHTGEELDVTLARRKRKYVYREAPSAVGDIRQAFEAFNDRAYGVIDKYLPSEMIPERQSLQLQVLSGLDLSIRGGAFYTKDDANPAVGNVWIGNAHTYYQDIFAHEGLPGHHVEMTVRRTHITDIEVLANANPMFDVGIYREGWANYAETIMQGSMFNAQDLSAATENRLLYDILEAVNAIVEVGVHSGDYRWNRGDICSIYHKYTFLGVKQIEDTLDSITTQPGSLLVYFFGRVFIQAQRAKAIKALGSSFDIKMFHRIVLSTPGPLPVVAAAIDQWISATVKPL